ncbi:MAG: D-2-hydroxyacid dehydrogenase [Chloroflexaceae bacterium]|nr:D-2-hydroxyacid dehydrogenase [Chloroflexaceae bacterium]NJL33595.1 D-2-hydroxyacid dehydrogenase [Chloroflexaceae bacterium]NJO05666.1 D-2-hydroxyacid dehydrogenase [Chloroflexaceae bacterium]
MDASSVTVLIASPLEPRYVERIKQVSLRLDVLYEPELLGTPRYAADHDIVPQRTPTQEAAMRSMLARAEVMFDFERTHLHDLLTVAPRLRWVQSTSSGVGELLRRHGLCDTDLIVTNAAGIHAIPLTEFCLMVMLMAVKRAKHSQWLQQQRHWERFHSTTLHGKTLGIVGLGAIGRHLAHQARTLGMTVHGVKATLPTDDLPAQYSVDYLWHDAQLAEVLPLLDFVVACLPLIPQTVHRFGPAEFALMKPSAYFINIGRGQTVNELALIDALHRQCIAGAALDVVAHEPLAPDSPLWALPNVLISPHSAATVDTENERLTELFCDNLQRYLTGQPLRNVIDKQRGY